MKALALALLLGLIATAPACSSSTRQARLHDAMTGLSIASSSLAAFDRAHQAEIVEKATSLAEGTAKLDAYRAARARVVALFAAAYHAIAAAAVLQSDYASLANALLAAELAITAWRDLTGGGP